MPYLPQMLQGVGFWVPGTLISNCTESDTGPRTMAGLVGLLARLKSRGVRLAAVQPLGVTPALPRRLETVGIGVAPWDWMGEAEGVFEAAATLGVPEAQWLWVSDVERDVGEGRLWLLDHASSRRQQLVGTWQDLWRWVYARTELPPTT